MDLPTKDKKNFSQIALKQSHFWPNVTIIYGTIICRCATHWLKIFTAFLIFFLTERSFLHIIYFVVRINLSMYHGGIAQLGARLKRLHTPHVGNKNLIITLFYLGV